MKIVVIGTRGIPEIQGGVETHCQELFPRIAAMGVVWSHHGPDYDRQKWGGFAKAVLRFGERMGARFSNKVIVISTVIADILRSKYGRTDSELIYNGVNISSPSSDTQFLVESGIRPGRYILAMGGLGEKRASRPRGWLFAPA